VVGNFLGRRGRRTGLGGLGRGIIIIWQVQDDLDEADVGVFVTILAID
jgi:hypothetical protein